MGFCHPVQRLTSHSRPTPLRSPPRPPSCWETWVSVAHRRRAQTSPIPWLCFHSLQFPHIQEPRQNCGVSEISSSSSPISNSNPLARHFSPVLTLCLPLSLTDTYLESFIFCPPSLDHTVDLNPSLTSIYLPPHSPEDT